MLLFLFLLLLLLLADSFDAGLHAKVLDVTADVVHKRRDVYFEQRLFAQVHGGLDVAAVDEPTALQRRVQRLTEALAVQRFDDRTVL